MMNLDLTSYNFGKIFLNHASDLNAQCDTYFGNPEFLNRLKSKNFTVILVDLVTNECGLMLAHHFGVPTVGFQGFGPTLLVSIGFETPATRLAFYSWVTDLTYFSQRLRNIVSAITFTLMNYGLMVYAYITHRVSR